MYGQQTIYEPFLVLHLCFCIHEYRRMRDDEPDQVIPSFTDPRRTIVVDLRPLAEAETVDNVIKADPFGITIEHTHATSTTRARLAGHPTRDSLPVLTLKELGDLTVTRVKVAF